MAGVEASKESGSSGSSGKSGTSGSSEICEKRGVTGLDGGDIWDCVGVGKEDNDEAEVRWE